VGAAGPLLSAKVDSRNGIGRIALQGELDTWTEPVLREHLDRLEIDGVKAITLDVRGLTFLDSTALQSFIEARSRAAANGHRFLIRGVGPRVRRLFEITGIEFLLDE